MSNRQDIGYLKYSGKSVEEGLLDARKSAEALLGFDEILRFFVLKEEPSLKSFDFEIPVRIKKGSWEAWIPAAIALWFSKEYLSSFAKSAATEGLFGTGPVKDISKIFKASFKSVQWIIKIASHVRELKKKKFDNAKIEQTSQGTFIKIPNKQNEYLNVPKKYFDLFLTCPANIFSKNAGIIETERTLELGVFENGREEKVSITEKDKYIFFTKPEEDEIVLPELKHGRSVELDGEITRATESVNTIGFRYQEHIIICKPESGNIAKFKTKIVSLADDHVFSAVKIIGTVDRTDVYGGFKEKRPTIIFVDLISLETETKGQSLFDTK